MKNYTFELTEQEVQVIGNALYELPFKVSAALIAKLQEQVNSQNKPVEETVKKK